MTVEVTIASGGAFGWPESGDSDSELRIRAKVKMNQSQEDVVIITCSLCTANNEKAQNACTRVSYKYLPPQS